MAQRHDIDIVITQQGEVHLEVKGVKGTKCMDLTKDIEEELGIVIEQEKKSEYYQQENQTEINISTGT